MKVKNLFVSALLFCGLFGFITLSAQNSGKQNPNYIQGPPQRTCGTEIPSQQWEELFQKKVAEFLAANPEISAAAKQGNNNTQAVYTIPVIIHVIHGGQAVGTFPNLAQGQLNSQVTVLNNDFAGVGQNVGNYPATAFTTWATNTIVSAASKDFSGRIKIANTGVTFCLALQDTLGNILAEPGIDRVNYNTLPALTGTFTSKNPANAVYNTPGKLQGFINGYIKPNTIWNVRKYLNIWVTDQNASVGLLGYATFPPLSGLTGIPGGVGTATTDGFWAWAAAFGSSTIFPGGTYAAPYDKGRTCTHEIGHWVGLRHIWGDGTCATDYCNDTPPASSSNFGNPAYPLKSGSCAGPPSNAPNGEMFMNFMDYTDDLAMYMFSEDQRTRLQTAMMNSPYRNQLGTHGLCSVPPPVANFSINPNPICAGQTSTITDMSTGSPGAWSYTTGGSPATSTLQSPVVTYTAAGVYSITLIASNGGGSSAPVVKTITVIAVPVVTVTASPSTVCIGSSATLTASGATTYSWNTSATTASIVVSPTVNTTYTVTGYNGTCSNTRTISVSVSGFPTVNIAPASATICSGNTATFTGSGATNYTWMPGGITTATISVSPTITTTYTLTGTNTAGCAGTRTTQVTVSTTPTVNVVASSTLICGGGSSTLTASGATTYSWNTSATTAAIVVSPTTTTNYTVTGFNGTCSNSQTISVSVSGSPTINVSPASATICSGNSTLLTGSGAVNYTWMPGGINTSTISASPTITTTYTLTGTNAGGCSGTRTVQVTVNTSPTVNVISTSTAICSGSSATLTASGATTYTWNTGATTAAIVVSPTITTNYTVTGFNGTCSDTRTISLTVNTTPTLNINPPSATVCIGSSVNLFGSGATNYTWMPGGMNTASINASPTITTIYTLTGANAGGCSGTRTVQVNVNPLTTVTITANPLTICPGSSSTLTANGSGSGPFNYIWNTGATTSAITTSITGVYTATVTNATGCSGSQSFTLNSASGLTITANSTPTSICAGSSATLSASGASTYTWNTGPTTSSIVVTPSVNTTYTVNGSNGSCSGTQTITVVVNPNPTVSAVSNPSIVCSGQTSTITANGATTYSWNTGPTTAAIVATPTINTTYTVTGTTSSGCSNTTTVSVAVMASPTINIVSTPTVICSGNSATIAASGASTYTWNTGPTTSAIIVNPTITTSYTVTGTSGAGCTTSQTVSLIVNSNPTVNVVSSPAAICSGNSSTLTASGAATYSWNTSATSAAIVVSPVATTNYTVTGFNGTCSNTQTISLTVNSTPTLSITPTSSAICLGTSVTLTGNGAINYTWMPGGMTTASVSVSPTVNTTYTLTGSNSFGCIGTRTAAISILSSPIITVTANPLVICPGNSSTLTANGSGPPGPFSYLWNTGATSAVITTSLAGVYTASFTNGNGCKAVQSVTITSGSVSITAVATPTSICSGGSTTLTASGATTYTWNTGPTTSSIIVSPTISTTYTVSGTSGSCTGTRTVAVVVNTTPTVTAITNPTAICSGSSATITASGATTYSWNTGATTAAITVSPGVTTTYTVTGSNGSCSGTRTVSLIVNTTPTVITVSSPTAICSGSSSTITASGATTYSWNTGATTAAIVVTPTATINYTVTGSNGTCSDTETVSITVSTTPTVTVIATPSIICSGNSSNLNASGASTYSWSTGASTSGISVSPSVTATYTVTGSNGSCSNTTTLSVSVIGGPSISVSSSSSVICVGQTAVLTASSSATTYTWSTGSNSISISVSPTVTTTYTLTGTNAAGCTGSTTTTQSVSPCTGINNSSAVSVNFGVYPNPNEGEFTLSSAMVTENTVVYVYNSLGQLILKQTLKETITKINMSEQADGVYYLKVMNANQQIYKTKLIKD